MGLKKEFEAEKKQLENAFGELIAENQCLKTTLQNMENPGEDGSVSSSNENSIKLVAKSKELEDTKLLLLSAETSVSILTTEKEELTNELNEIKDWSENLRKESKILEDIKVSLELAEQEN